MYFLLSKYDRNSEFNKQISKVSGVRYPYFYLLNWSFQFDEFMQRKVAIQSPFRSQNNISINDAPFKNQINAISPKPRKRQGRQVWLT